MHIAIAMETKNKLLPSLELLNRELKKKVSQFKNIVKVGRTHLQDATPLSLGQEFSGYQSQLEDCIVRIKNALNEIYYLAQGGTAVGTGINSKKGFDKKVINEIKKITKLPFKPTKNKFAALAAHDEIVNFSGTLNTTAVSLMKMANDIRFLGSGPRAGYGEIILPANEPGSSIMPGKVNPTQSEAVTMVCVKVIGNHNGITMAGSHGHFELNVFKPLIAHNILQSIDLLADSTKNFSLYCIKGIKADKVKIKKFLDNSLMLVTALAPHIGYDNSAKIAKTALKKGTTLKEEALKTKLINEKDFDRIINPFIENLKLLGIEAKHTRIDSTQYTERVRNFEWEIITSTYGNSLTPGIELVQQYSSKTADVPSRNLVGLKNEGIDILINLAANSKTRKELNEIIRSLDRSLRSLHIWVPQWYKKVHTVAYRNHYSYPKNLPPFDLGAFDFWWFDNEKAEILNNK